MNTITIADNYHCSITIPAWDTDVYTDICRVADWWTSDFEGRSEKQDDIFTIRFGETFVTFQITEAIANKKIVWLVTDSNLHWLVKNKKEWNNTEIIWEITPGNNGTQLSMTHVGLTPEVECYENCEPGWNHCIKDSLFQLITKGVGLPEKAK